MTLEPEIIFQEFPKIPRYRREIAVTWLCENDDIPKGVACQS